MGTSKAREAILTDTIDVELEVRDEDGEPVDSTYQTITVQQALDVIHLAVEVVEALRIGNVDSIQWCQGELDDCLTVAGLVDPKEN